MTDDTTYLALTWLDPQSLKRAALVCRGWCLFANQHAVTLEHGRALVRVTLRGIIRSLNKRHTPTSICNSDCARVPRLQLIVRHVRTTAAELVGTPIHQWELPQLLGFLYNVAFPLGSLEPWRSYSLEWCARVEHQAAPAALGLQGPRLEVLARLACAAPQPPPWRPTGDPTVNKWMVHIGFGGPPKPYQRLTSFRSICQPDQASRSGCPSTLGRLTVTITTKCCAERAQGATYWSPPGRTSTLADRGATY